jgi:AcrR family transcriptional regulator
MSDSKNATAQESRRGRKRVATHASISEAAWRLFDERGFAAVTVAEIAAAADVAVGTLFNYFPSKEAIFFDRAGDLADGLRAAVADRPAGEPAAAAFRRWNDAALHALAAPAGAARLRRFFELVDTSPSLQGHERALRAGYGRVLADVLAADGSPGDPTPALLAGQLVALHGGLVDLVRGLVLSGARPATVRRRLREATDRGFALLSPGALAWPRRFSAM